MIWHDFLRRKGDSAPHLKEIIIHVFITTGQIQKLNKNYKIFESKGVSGALHSLRILHIGRIVSGCNYKGKVLFLLDFLLL